MYMTHHVCECVLCIEKILTRRTFSFLILCTMLSFILLQRLRLCCRSLAIVFGQRLRDSLSLIPPVLQLGDDHDQTELCHQEVVTFIALNVQCMYNVHRYYNTRYILNARLVHAHISLLSLINLKYEKSIIHIGVPNFKITFVHSLFTGAFSINQV